MTLSIKYQLVSIMWVWEPLLITSGELSRARTCYRGRAPVVGNSHVLAVIRGWVHNLDLVTHRGADSVHHRDQQGPGVGPRLPGVAHRKYKHHSRVRAETATRENITGVWTMWTLWTLSAGPPPIMIMASFFSSPPTSSSSQRLNTD